MNLVKGDKGFEQAEKKAGTSDSPIKFMKAGDSILVGVHSASEFVMTHTHSVFDAVKNVPVILTTLREEGSLYDKAVQLLWDDYNLVKTDEIERKKVLNKINALKAKPTFYFGFTNIEDGKELIISVSENQAKTIKTAISKLEKQLKKFPLEIVKGEKGTWSIMPYMDDLNTVQENNFKATSEIAIEVYESVMFKADLEKQAQDMKKFGEHFGFDIARLGLNPNEVSTEQKQEPKTEDYGF